MKALFLAVTAVTSVAVAGTVTEMTSPASRYQTPRVPTTQSGVSNNGLQAPHVIRRREISPEDLKKMTSEERIEIQDADERRSDSK